MLEQEKIAICFGWEFHEVDVFNDTNIKEVRRYKKLGLLLSFYIDHEGNLFGSAPTVGVVNGVTLGLSLHELEIITRGK